MTVDIPLPSGSILILGYDTDGHYYFGGTYTPSSPPRPSDRDGATMSAMTAAELSGIFQAAHLLYLRNTYERVSTRDMADEEFLSAFWVSGR